MPQEVNSSYIPKPAGEPAIDDAHVEAFKKYFANSKSSLPIAKSSVPTSTGMPKQRSEA